MAFKYFERCFFLTATTGQGSLTVAAAVTPAFNTPADAGGVDTDSSTWLIEEGNDYEIFNGTLSSSGTVLSRDTVLESKIGGTVGTTKMSLLGNATVRCIPSAHQQLIGPQTAITDGYLVLWDSNNRKLKQGAGAPGSAALKNTGTSGNTVPTLDGKNSWSATQLVAEYALTNATAWDGSTYQNLTVSVSGADFAVANPSTLPPDGSFVAIEVTFGSSNNLTFGNKFKGMTGVTPSNVSGKVDGYIFKSDGTNLNLWGYRQDITT